MTKTVQTFDINNDNLTIVQSEPDPMTLEIEQSKIKKKFNQDEWLVIGLYMTNGDCILSYNQVFVSNDKRSNKKKSKLLFERSDVIVEIKRRLQIMIKYNLHLIHRIIQEYETLAFSNIDDVAVWSERNLLIKPSALLSRKDKSTIQEIKMTKYGPSIKLHSKKDSLDSLSKIVGILRDSINLTTNDISDQPTNTKPVVILPNNNRG